MFIVNGLKANWYKFNRNTTTGFYDDKDITTTTLKLCPYNGADNVKFEIYSHPEATGYYIVDRRYPVKIGDQLQIFQQDGTLQDRKLTVLKAQDNWCFNRVENLILAVK